MPSRSLDTRTMWHRRTWSREGELELLRLAGAFWPITHTEQVMTKAECLCAHGDDIGINKGREQEEAQVQPLFLIPLRAIPRLWEFPTGSINTGISLRKENVFQRVAVSNCFSTDIGIANPKNISTIRQACARATRVHTWEEATRPRKPKGINPSSNTNSSHWILVPNTLCKAVPLCSRPEESCSWSMEPGRKAGGEGTRELKK